MPVEKATSAAPIAVAKTLGIRGIAYLAIGFNAPGPDRVVVVEVVFAAHGKQFRQSRLHVSGLIHRSALNDRGFAIPVPGQAEARQCACQDWLLKLRFLPALAVIEGNIDALDLAATAPG